MPVDEISRRFTLSNLLTKSRARIKPGDVGLPSYGHRRVSGLRREEVAELTGVSTRWYEQFESGKGDKHFSFDFVQRVAEALRLDENERATLFKLALPEVSKAISPPARRPSALTEQSELVLDAFASFRDIVRRLWAASSEAEALTLIREHGAAQLKPDFMNTLTRGPEGVWDRATTAGSHLAKKYDALAQGDSSGRFIDDLCCYSVMAKPGEVITRSERDALSPWLAAKERPILDAIGMPDLSFAMANIQSQHGLTARLLSVHRTAHHFGETEVAQVSTLADLASLALSGYASSPP